MTCCVFIFVCIDRWRNGGDSRKGEKTIEPWTSSLNNNPEKFIEKEKSYHEKSLQRILFQGVERYVIILMYLWLT